MLAISLLIAACCLAPRFIKSTRNYSQILLLIGTGALMGIYFFDLLPDVIELGGRSSLVIVLAVWALYSVLHSFHLHAHARTEREIHTHDTRDGIVFLMVSMVTHCIASGMFLELSHTLSASIERGVFWALLAHKGYEALSVSMVLQERVRNTRRLALLTLVYALSFPAGVGIMALLTRWFGTDGANAEVLRTVAIGVASVAAGSLLGCMIHDFVIPSFKQVRQRRSEAAWVALGLFGTLAATFAM